MAGRRRGARSGRGWDALPPRTARQKNTAQEERAGGNTPASRSRRSTAASDDWRDSLAWPDGAVPASEVRPGHDERDDSAQDPGETAREICLRLLAVRPRTRAELATALRRRGVTDEVASEVLDRYDEVGIIDDAAFARAWVTSRHHGKGLARRALAGELRRRGVDDETVRGAVEELDGDTEAETARALVDRKLRTLSTGEPEAVLRKLVAMLARKGYSPGLAFRVVKEALAEHGGQAAEFADQVDADALAEAAESGPPADT